MVAGDGRLAPLRALLRETSNAEQVPLEGEEFLRARSLPREHITR
jgi:hypothetical protein